VVGQRATHNPAAIRHPHGAQGLEVGRRRGQRQLVGPGGPASLSARAAVCPGRLGVGQRGADRLGVDRGPALVGPHDSTTGAALSVEGAGQAHDAPVLLADRSGGQLGWTIEAFAPPNETMRMPVRPLLCVIDGRTRGRPWASDAARVRLRRVAAKAGVRRRFAPHQLRHAHAVELAHEGVPLNVIQRQLGHTNLGVTSYLQGIDSAEIIATVHARKAPMIPASTGLRL
jgi:Phage integrase family